MAAAMRIRMLTSRSLCDAGGRGDIFGRAALGLEVFHTLKGVLKKKG